MKPKIITEACHRLTNTLPLQQEDFHHQEHIINPHQRPEANYILESHDEDTGLHQSTTHTAQYIPQEDDLSTAFYLIGSQ